MVQSYWSVRGDLADAPQVRSWIARMLDSPVLAWTPAVGGFSAGIAARVEVADGRKAFVKAVDENTHSDTASLFRAEAATLQDFSTFPALRPLIAPLIATLDHAGWVGLLLEEVDGETLRQPFIRSQVAAVDDGLGRLADALDDISSQVEAPDMPVTAMSNSWSPLARDAHLFDPWTRSHLREITSLATRAGEVLRGDHLLHSDLRSDNIMVGGVGVNQHVVFIDWAWMCRGARWFDSFMLAFDLATSGGEIDADDYVASSNMLADVASQDITSALAAFTGEQLLASRQPSNRVRPDFRAWQEHLGSGGLAWLRKRMNER